MIADTTTHHLDLGVRRDDRYDLEVSFPSAPGSRIVVGPAQNPLLAGIDPSTIPNRTIVVYRDGRVVLGGGPPLGGPPPAAPGTAATVALDPEFGEIAAGFTIYYQGTVCPAWGDYDGDGDLDLPLFQNQGNGTFAEIPGFRSLLLGGNYHGSAWCDYDHDGDLDLVMLSYVNVPTQNLVLQNQGNGTFVDVAAPLGMNVAGYGETAVWGDFDNDGDPDLYAPFYAHVPPYRSFLYRNDGGGTFTEIADWAGVSMRDVPAELKPEGAVAVDWDDDGDLDLYCASHLFVNDGTGRFTDVRAEVGLPARFDDGATLVDVDSDGDFDLYTRNVDSARLFRNDGGWFTDVTALAGITPASFHWGDSFADVDNDGDLDLLYFDRNQPTRLMINRGDGTFTVDPSSGAEAAHHGMSAWADYDNDGDLDFVDGAQEFAMYVNRIEGQPGFESSFLRVHVVDADSVANQQGATVRLRRLDGPTGVVQTRAVEVGAAYLAHNEYRTHLGLGLVGGVTRDPDLAAYPAGTPVRITAVPAPGYHFTGWVGDAGGLANPLDVVMDGARQIRATFALDAYTLQATAGTGGTVTRSPERAEYPVGSRVAVTAVPSPGYQFVGWSGDTTGSANPMVVVMGDHVSITASFALNNYTLAVSALGEGSVTRDPDLASYPHGAQVQLTAVPALGYHFERWAGDASGTDNPLTITLESDRVVAAIFTINSYVLELTVAGSGVVTRDPDQTLYTHGTRVWLTAQPGTGGTFAGWSGDAGGTTNPLSVIMDRPRSITATFDDIAVHRWDGGGDGVSYSDPANWDVGAAPSANAEVILDQSAVAGSYTVQLPAGNVSVQLSRLSILPAPGRTITLVLPSSNTGNPGLRVGDGTAGTVDVRLASGAVLRNASGASSGSRIQLNGSTNGTLAIENGARYEHATRSSADGVVSRLATGTGTERGEFVYDVPGNSSFAISSSGATYGSLTFVKTSGSGGYSAGGSLPLAVRGHLRIAAGAALSSSMSGDLVLRGDLVNDGASLALPGGQRVRFEGDTVQRVSGVAAVTLSGPSTIGPATTVALGTAPFSVNGTMTVAGTLRLDAPQLPTGSGPYQYDSMTGRLVFNHPSGNLGISAPAYWPSMSGPPHVEVRGPEGITMNVSRTVPGSFLTRGPVSRSNRLTLLGLVRLEPGGSLPRSPMYGPASTLVYAREATADEEWVPGDSAGAGVPRHVVIDAGSDSVTLAGTPRTVTGDLTVLSGVLSLQTELRLRGGVTVGGALWGGWNALRFVGSGVQRIAGAGLVGGTALALQQGSGGIVRLERDLACAADTGWALEYAGASGRLDLAGRRLTIVGAVGGADAAGAVAGGPGSGLALLGAEPIGTLRMAPGSERLRTLLLDLGPGAHAAIPSALQVDDTLALLGGRLEVGDVLTVAPGGIVTRAAGHVAGALRKSVGPGAGGVGFEIGSGDRYAPVELSFGTVATGGTLVARTVDGDHPALAASTIDPARSVNRHWTLTAEGVAFDTCAATFHYPPADLDPGVDPAVVEARRHHAGAWSWIEPGTRAPGRLEARGLTALGDFAAGDAATWTLATSASGRGSVTRAPDQPAYDHRSAVVVSAAPDSGHRFLGWAGDTVAADSVLALTLVRDRTLAARFTVALEVSTAGAGSGTVTRDPEGAAVVPGTLVRLTAAPAHGSEFAGWTGDTSAAANPLDLRVDRDRSLVARFDPVLHPLEVLVSGAGTVVKTPDAPSYPVDSLVHLVARPAPGYAFEGWAGDTTAADTVLVVRMTRPLSVIATFADHLAPVARVLTPNGGEALILGSTVQIAWEAEDGSGITAVDLLLSRRGAAGPFETLATGEPHDGLHEWTVAGPPTQEAVVMVVAHDAGGNAGIDLSDTTFTISPSLAGAEDEAVTAFALGSITPNPLRRATLVEYAVAAEARVRLAVLDIQGREVAVLVDGPRPRGRHRVAWSGETAGGRVAAGLYFIRYSAPGGAWTRRVVVTR